MRINTHALLQFQNPIDIQNSCSTGNLAAKERKKERKKSLEHFLSSFEMSENPVNIK